MKNQLFTTTNIDYLLLLKFNTTLPRTYLDQIMIQIIKRFSKHSVGCGLLFS